MHAYLIILEISPLKVANIYDALPLHCTLVHWFWLDVTPEQLARKLQQQLSDTGPITLEAQGEKTFTGKTRQGTTIPVTVNGVVETPALRALHERACDVLDSMGARYSEPDYVRSGFQPHVTHQRDGKLPQGAVRTSAKLYLIGASAPEYGNDRIVHAVIDL